MSLRPRCPKFRTCLFKRPRLNPHDCEYVDGLWLLAGAVLRGAATPSRLACRSMDRVCWTFDETMNSLVSDSLVLLNSPVFLAAEMVAGKLSPMPRAFVPCTGFVGTARIDQGLTVLRIRQAPHLTAQPCRNCRMSVLSSPLNLEEMQIIAAQRSRSTR